MVALRIRPLAAFASPFWFSALCAALAPTSIGHQDLAGFLARQPGVSERWRDHLIASPFGTIHAATFSFSRPIGTTVSEPGGAQAVNFDPRSLDVKVWFGNNGSLFMRPALQVEYPTVNRRLKGNRMPAPEPAAATGGTETLPQLRPINAPATRPAPPASPPISGPRPKSVERLDDGLAAPIDAFGSLPIDMSASADVTGSIPPTAVATAVPERDGARDAETDDDMLLADKPPEIPAAGEGGEGESARSLFSSLSTLNEDPAERNAQLYFGGGVMGAPGCNAAGTILKDLGRLQ